MDRDAPQRRNGDLPKVRRCALCGKTQEPRFRPFCSARCRDIDLGRWFNQAYSAPATEPGYDEDDA